MNNQKPEPKDNRPGHFLEVHSIFFTIQGEGPFVGHPAIFIRLAGCNLQCPKCDTEYTQGRNLLGIEEIILEARKTIKDRVNKFPMIVITGGEPLRQNIGLLCEELLHYFKSIQIESNGVFSPDEELYPLLLGINPAVRLVVSPKTKVINSETARLAYVYKYVLAANSISIDGLPLRALDHPSSQAVARPPSGWKGDIYLSPMDAKTEAENKANLDAVVASAMSFGYIAGVQMHKIMNLE
jgi:7-carboxy-7-deazaguanine synthase